MYERYQNLYVTDWEQTRPTVDSPLIPIVIDLTLELNDISFFERQFVLVFGFEVI